MKRHKEAAVAANKRRETEAGDIPVGMRTESAPSVEEHLRGSARDSEIVKTFPPENSRGEPDSLGILQRALLQNNVMHKKGESYGACGDDSQPLLVGKAGKRVLGLESGEESGELRKDSKGTKGDAVVVATRTAARTQGDNAGPAAKDDADVSEARAARESSSVASSLGSLADDRDASPELVEEYAQAVAGGAKRWSQMSAEEQESRRSRAQWLLAGLDPGDLAAVDDEPDEDVGVGTALLNVFCPKCCDVLCPSGAAGRQRRGGNGERAKDEETTRKDSRGGGLCSDSDGWLATWARGIVAPFCWCRRRDEMPKRWPSERSILWPSGRRRKLPKLQQPAAQCAIM